MGADGYRVVGSFPIFAHQGNLEYNSKWSEKPTDWSFEKFDDYYEKGYIDRVITTNLTYLPAEAKEKPYFLIADMSKFIALIIDSMNHDISIGKVMDPTEKIHRLLAKHNTSL